MSVSRAVPMDYAMTGKGRNPNGWITFEISYNDGRSTRRGKERARINDKTAVTPNHSYSFDLETGTDLTSARSKSQPKYQLVSYQRDGETKITL